MVDLAEDWAERRFGVYFRDAASLSPAAALLVRHLQTCAQHAAQESGRLADRLANHAGR
jgi:hypothetical protein